MNTKIASTIIFFVLTILLPLAPKTSLLLHWRIEMIVAGKHCFYDVHTADDCLDGCDAKGRSAHLVARARPESFVGNGSDYGMGMVSVESRIYRDDFDFFYRINLTDRWWRFTLMGNPNFSSMVYC